MAKDPRPLTQGVTVDGPTSRDLDDAIWVSRNENGWQIEVSISDVSDSIPKGGDVDEEARRRAFTRYFATGNRPMLPRQLADNELSLLPRKSRKTITFSITLSEDLTVIRTEIVKTRLSSQERFTYKEVDGFLDDESCAGHTWWRDCFELAQRLLNKRRERGALVVFDLKKGLLTNEEGDVERMPEGQYYRAYLIIQELMILTNHAVTSHLLEQGVTLLLRNHTTRKEEVRAQYLEALGKLLVEPTAEMLEELNAESRHIMNRARYGPENQGHFALSLSAYAHWTSPIRRFADLVNHRILHAHLQGAASPYELSELVTIGEHLNAVSDEMRDGKCEVYREKLLNRLSNADKQKLLALDEGEFDRFIKWITDETLPLDHVRAEVICERIAAGSVAVAEITRILFAGTEADELWCELKENAMQWLENNPSQVFQIFPMAHQFCRFPHADTLKLDTEQSGESHSPQFHSRASLYRGGQKCTSETFTASTRRRAELMAAFDLIERLASFPRKSKGTLQMEAPETSDVGNAKGLLLEICMKEKIAPPNYDSTRGGEDHRANFTCVATLVVGSKTLTSAPHVASNKKHSEQLASADLLAQLSSDTELAVGDSASAEKASSIATTAADNPVGALQEWCQARSNGRVPDYSFKSSGPPNAPVFSCTCVLRIGGQRKQWTAVGGTKQRAKRNAAVAACEEILSQ